MAIVNLFVDVGTPKEVRFLLDIQSDLKRAAKQAGGALSVSERDLFDTQGQKISPYQARIMQIKVEDPEASGRIHTAVSRIAARRGLHYSRSAEPDVVRMGTSAPPAFNIG